MSILNDYMQEFAFMDKSHVRDDEGNTSVTFTQSGWTFRAAMRFDNSIQAKRAQAEGVKDVYTLIVNKSIDLDFNDVVKCLEDGLTYRVTTNGKDNRTPKSAGLNMRAVSAERWDLPDD